MKFTKVVCAITLTCSFLTFARSNTADPAVSIRAGHSGSIIAVRNNPKAKAEGAVAGVTFPHPQPRLAGFSPLVAITTSDKKRPTTDDSPYEHTLESTYSGNTIYLFPEAPYIIGFLDSGAVVDLTSDFYGFVLGVTDQYLTENTIPIGGVGGTVDGIVSQPLGYFAAGFSAIDENFDLNFAALKGHSNDSLVVGPDLNCGNNEELTAVVGTPMMSHFISVIRVDTPRRVLYDERYFLGPDVQILDLGTPFPIFPRKIGMDLTTLGALPVVAANYYPDPLDKNLETPFVPTMLSLTPASIPTGAVYFCEMFLRQGPPDFKNPGTTVRVMVDTGAQSSIISPGVAADLNLPSEPDFTVDVCGVGGLMEDVPGFYIDFVQINASGGALRFSRAPFIVLDLPSPEGGPLAGILGMNFFWNRNIIFEGTLEPFDPENPPTPATPFLHVSDPVPFAAPDFDLDLHVDAPDAGIQNRCATGPGSGLATPDCAHTDVDADADVDLADFAILQMCFSGSGPADPVCGH